MTSSRRKGPGTSEAATGVAGKSLQRTRLSFRLIRKLACFDHFPHFSVDMKC